MKRPCEAYAIMRESQCADSTGLRATITGIRTSCQTVTTIIPRQPHFRQVVSQKFCVCFKERVPLPPANHTILALLCQDI